MNVIMNKKNNGKRLIAAVAIFAMLACVFAFAVPMADATNGENTTHETVEVGDVSFLVPEGVSVTYSGGVYEFSGFVIPSASSDIVDTDGNFEYWFTDQAVGYNYIGMNGINVAEGNYWILQENPALGTYTDRQWNITTDADGNEYKISTNGTTGYTGTTNGYYFLIPNDEDDKVVTIQAVKGEIPTEETDNPYNVSSQNIAATYTLDFSDVVYAYDAITFGDDDQNDVTINTPVDGLYVTFDSDGNAVFYGEAISVNSNSDKAYSNVEGNANFNDTFGNTFPAGSQTHEIPWGYSYAKITNLDKYLEGNANGIVIVQENSALYFYQDKSADNTVDDGVKTKLYTTNNAPEEYAFLIPKSGDMTVTVTVYAANADGKKTGTALQTIVMDFSNVSTEAVVSNESSLAGAIANNDEITIDVKLTSDPGTTYDISDKVITISADNLPTTTTLDAGTVLNLGDVTAGGLNGKTIKFAGTGNVTSATVKFGNDFAGQGISVIQGSVEISGQYMTGTITVTDDVKITQLAEKYGNGTSSTEGLTINASGNALETVTVDSNITIYQPATGAGLTLGENVAIDASGRTITLVPSDNNTSPVIELGTGTNVSYLYVEAIEGAGTIHVPRGATLVYNTISSGVTINADEGAIVKAGNGQGTENEISDSQNVVGNQYLSADTTILEGVTLTVPRNATLDLAGYNLIVYGTIEVANGGTIISSVDRNGNTGTIVLKTSGSIVNDGTIGTDRMITVKNGANTETQTVQMKQVSGVSFEIVRSGTGTDRVYDMAISGDVSRISGAEEPTLTINNVDINKNLTIGRNVTFNVTGNVDVAAGVTVTNGGALMEITGTGFTLLNGATLVVSSHLTGVVNVDVGTVGDNNIVNGTDATVTFEDTATGYVTGITITSGRVTEAHPTIANESIVDQRMYLSGNLNAVSIVGADGRPISNQPVAEISISGTAYVNETLSVPEDVRLTIDGYFDVSAAGTVTVVEGETQDIAYFGAKYTVETTANADTVVTAYYTNFANAMGQIANADEQTVYVSGNFTITGTYTLADGQTIELDNVYTLTADDKGVVVGEASVITVSTDADIDNDAFKTIEGRVVVLEGTGYKPTAGQGIYAVVTVDETTNDTTYSGFKVALDNAAAGQTITVVDDATYKGSMTVPAQVTVEVDDECTLTVTGNVTVEQNGTLLLGDGSKLVVGTNGRDASITVNGTLTAEGATIEGTAGANVDLYSTGTTTVDSLSSFVNVDYNAAAYVDVETVLTSVSAAVEYAEQNALSNVKLYGTFTDTTTVDSDDVDIIVTNGAVVTLGNVTLANAYIGVEGTGVYTATVSGLSGEGDAAVTSTVTVSKTQATIENDVVMNAEGVNQYSMTIDAITNAVQFTAGTFEIIGDEETETIDINLSRNGNSISISAGATLLVGEGTIAKISGGSYLANAGTILIEGAVVIDGDTTIPGTVMVAEDGSLDVDGEVTLTITGTVNIDAEGDFEVTGDLQVGETPEVLNSVTTGSVVGKVTLVDNAYVLVYTGASVAETDIGNAAGDEIKSTAYSINGVDFATVYLTGTQSLKIVNPVVGSLQDLLVGTTGIVWYSGESPVSSSEIEALDANIGDYTEVSAEIQYNAVPIYISVGTHITLSIDNMIYDVNGTQRLTIGTHTVSVVIDPGYSGNVVITFNGQTVQNGGTIEITSDMIGHIDDIVLSASGQLTQDSTVVIDGGSSGDSGMGLTDYLLIILVILIVVMAIMVAMRLMRS